MTKLLILALAALISSPATTVIRAVSGNAEPKPYLWGGGPASPLEERLEWERLSIFKLQAQIDKLKTEVAACKPQVYDGTKAR